MSYGAVIEHVKGGTRLRVLDQLGKGLDTEDLVRLASFGKLVGSALALIGEATEPYAWFGEVAPGPARLPVRHQIGVEALRSAS